VGTTTWQSISFLCSVLHFPSQLSFLCLRTSPRTDRTPLQYTAVLQYYHVLVTPTCFEHTTFWSGVGIPPRKESCEEKRRIEQRKELRCHVGVPTRPFSWYCAVEWLATQLRNWDVPSLWFLWQSLFRYYSGKCVVTQVAWDPLPKTLF